MLSNHFRKLHSCGNSMLVFFDPDPVEKTYDKELVVRLLSTEYGVGADNLLVARPSKDVDFDLVGYNSDGSPVGMCLNGVRCVARFLQSEGLVRSALDNVVFRLENQRVVAHFLRDRNGWVGVDVPPPSFSPEDVPHMLPMATSAAGDYVLSISGQDRSVVCLSVGNPHCILFLDDFKAQNLKDFPNNKSAINYLLEVGPVIESSPAFPEKTNLELVYVKSRDRLEVLIWERAVGFTQASGSGSVAAFAAARHRNLVDSEVTVVLPGGEFLLRELKGGFVRVSGPVVDVMRGILTTGGVAPVDLAVGL